MFGETKRLKLRKNTLSIHGNFKRATMPFDQRGNHAVFFLNRILQTCSIGQVVSFNAVFNRDIHEPHSLERDTVDSRAHSSRHSSDSAPSGQAGLPTLRTIHMRTLSKENLSGFHQGFGHGGMRMDTEFEIRRQRSHLDG